MRAAFYTERGPAREVLHVADVADPQPGPGEVRVRLRASGVNPTDWKSRSAGPPLTAPQIPGQDGAGVIDAVGEGVDPARTGQRVWVYHAAFGRPGGTAAQWTCVPAEQSVPLPEHVSFDQGAGLGIPYITAHRCVFAGGPVQGRTLLVTGGAGAVGNAAIQLAQWAGARVVTTVSSAEKAMIASAADVVLDYTDADFPAQLRAAAPDGVHRVVDVNLPANLERDLDVLAPHGEVVTYASYQDDPQVPIRALMTKNATLQFVLVYHLTGPMLADAVRDITAALSAGVLQPLPERHFPLDDVAAAHEAVEHGAVGKVLVDLP